jgi:hypothetical protein
MLEGMLNGSSTALFKQGGIEVIQRCSKNLLVVKCTAPRLIVIQRSNSLEAVTRTYSVMLDFDRTLCSHLVPKAIPNVIASPTIFVLRIFEINLYCISI